MDTLDLKFVFLKLNPFLISLGFHSLVLAAVVYGSANHNNGLTLSSMGDLSIELVGVDGGQGGQVQSPKSATQKGHKPAEKKSPTVASNLKAAVALHKVDEFSTIKRVTTKEPQKLDTASTEDSISQHTNQAQRSQALNVADQDSSGLTGRPGSQGGGSLYRTYIQNLYTHLERNKHYPMLARKMRIEGQVHVSFHVLRDGTIENVQLVGPCGSEVLNQAAIKSVKKASGQWPLPSSIRGDALPLQISFNYRIN